MNGINWERVKQEAFTSIRANFTLATLILINEDSDNYTPVSGDMIAQIRKGYR